MLRFDTDHFIGTITNGSSIYGLALTQTGNEEMMGHFLGGFHCITGMHCEPLLRTTSHHHCNGHSQYHFFHFIIPDNFIISGYAGANIRNIILYYQ